MNKSTLEVVEGITGCLILAVWIMKYYTHFTYRKMFDPALNKLDFMGFLFSFSTNTSLKMAFCIPWIWKNTAAEAQIQGLAQKRMKIVALSILMVVLFVAVMILSDYDKSHFGIPEE